MTAQQAPAEAPDMTLVRKRRDPSGAYRVYVADILVGRLDLIRTRGTTGRHCSRWRGTPTRAAFTLNRIGATIPPAATFTPLPAEHLQPDGAMRALVDHLRAAGAASVEPLYRPTP